MVLAGEVKAPVAVEVAVGGECAELQDGLGALEASAGAGDVEPVDPTARRDLWEPGGEIPLGHPAP